MGGRSSRTAWLAACFALALSLRAVGCTGTTTVNGYGGELGGEGNPDVGDRDAGGGGDLDASADPEPHDASDAADVRELSRDPGVDPVRGDALDAADTGPPPTPPEVPQISEERLAELRADLDAALGDDSVSGRTLSALVVEAESGRVLYEADADMAQVPASNTKLFTTAAALVLLGPDHRFVTRVYGDEAPDESGTLDGDLYLVVEHDFTFSTDFYASARFPLDRLADQLYGLGLRQVTGTVWLYGELVYDGNSLGEYDPAAHRAAGVSAFREALAARGIAVDVTDTSESFDPPDGAVSLTEWRSVPLSVACSPINRVSHNEDADILMRHLGYTLRGQSTYADGDAAVLDWLEEAGFDTTGLSLNDGSGLSYDNRVSARHVVSLQQLMDGLPEGRVWRGTFSVAGLRGTLAGRLTGPDTLGRVFGKTGSLAVAIATSGFLVNRTDGRRYLFSFQMNDQPSQTAARAAQDHAIEAFAGDLLAAGTRPAPPELRWVLDAGDGARAVAGWLDGGGGAEGYWVWRSADGSVWRRQDALYTRGTQLAFAPLGTGDRVEVRITAVSAAGESDPSDVYAVRVSEGGAPLLLVDGNERWQREPQPENPLAGGHDFVVRDALAVAEAAFDSASNGAIRDGEVDLDAYAAVVWSLGEESVDDESFDAAEQAAVTAYLEGGGQLFVSGAELGWDLVAEGSAEDKAFCLDVLRAGYVADDAGTYLVSGASGPLAGLPTMGFYTPDDLVVSYPDRLAPANGSAAVLTYLGGTGDTAAVAYDGDYRTVVLGFPFESLDGEAERAAFMDDVLAFFGL